MLHIVYKLNYPVYLIYLFNYPPVTVAYPWKVSIFSQFVTTSENNFWLRHWNLVNHSGQQGNSVNSLTIMLSEWILTKKCPWTWVLEFTTTLQGTQISLIILLKYTKINQYVNRKVTYLNKLIYYFVFQCFPLTIARLLLCNEYKLTFFWPYLLNT